MTDVMTKAQRSFNMSQIKRQNTKPELRLRKELASKRLTGYRIKSKLLGKPDIIYTKRKVVVFVDGCFWHKCPSCFRMPSTNTPFWNKKLSTNVKRDKLTNKRLRENGWKVIRVWEHDLRKKDINKTINKVIKNLEGK